MEQHHEIIIIDGTDEEPEPVMNAEPALDVEPKPASESPKPVHAEAKPASEPLVNAEPVLDVEPKPASQPPGPVHAEEPKLVTASMHTGSPTSSPAASSLDTTVQLETSCSDNDSDMTTPTPPLSACPPVARPPVARPPVARPSVARPPVARPPAARPPAARPPAVPTADRGALKRKATKPDGVAYAPDNGGVPQARDCGDRPTKQLRLDETIQPGRRIQQGRNDHPSAAEIEDERVIQMLRDMNEPMEPPRQTTLLRPLLRQHLRQAEPNIPRPPPLRPNRSLRAVTVVQRSRYITMGETRLVPAPWPNRIVSLGDQYNPDGIIFQNVNYNVMCRCQHPCRVESCDNAQLYVYCNLFTCPYSGLCGNGLEPSRYLSLMRTAGTYDYTVVATNNIDKGVVIGEYLGEMKLESYTANQRPPNTGYRFYMNHDLEHNSNQRVCIDAIRYGSLLRFVNHSCFPNVRFRQVCYGEHHTVVLVTARALEPGEEVLANYGDNIWFDCRCGSVNCRHRAVIEGANDGGGDEEEEDADADDEANEGTTRATATARAGRGSRNVRNPGDEDFESNDDDFE